MALCLAESLIETGNFDPVDQLERYARWYREGYMSSTDSCFDIGHTVRSARTVRENARALLRFCASKQRRKWLDHATGARAVTLDS